MHASAYRSLGALVLTVNLGACMTWQTTTVPPRTLIEEEAPKSMRITGFDGSPLVTLAEPRIEGDSLVGREVSGGEDWRTSVTDLERMLDDDRYRVQVQRFSAGKTILGVAPVLLVGGPLVVLLFCGERCTNP